MPSASLFVLPAKRLVGSTEAHACVFEGLDSSYLHNPRTIDDDHQITVATVLLSCDAEVTEIDRGSEVPAIPIMSW